MTHFYDLSYDVLYHVCMPLRKTEIRKQGGKKEKPSVYVAFVSSQTAEPKYAQLSFLRAQECAKVGIWAQRLFFCKGSVQEVVKQ